MPNPKEYDNESDWMHDCVPTREAEGNKHDQAVAACLNMWRKKERGEGQGQGGERQGDGGAETCICPKCGKELGHERGEPCTEKKCPECGATMIGKEIEMEQEVKDTVWDAFTSWNALMRLVGKEKPMKTVGGKRYPSSDFLVVEDAQKVDTWHLQVKRNGTPDHDLMGAAKAALTSAGGHRGNPYKGPGKQGAIAKLKRLYNSEGMEWADTKETTHPFMIWKDEETGRYRWLAIYSNKWRDEDNPPEILASTAHKEFVEAVDKGEWPHPELWLWHIPGSRFGVADLVAYDDNGFALASGMTDKDKEYIAKALAEYDGDLAMSHGMPVKEIERDEEDPTIITRYRTVEVSPLPRSRAANKYGTGIEILREVKMAIPDEKRSKLQGMLGNEGLEQLESNLADKAKEYDEELESKNADEAPETEEQESEEAEPKEAESKEEAPEAPRYVTEEQVAEAVGLAIKPMIEQLQSLVLGQEAMGDVVNEQAKEIKALKKDEEDKLKETIANTPAASLFEQIQSVIGSEETQVDGRTKLGKEGPKETLDDQGPTPVGIINQLMAQSWGQQ